MQVGGSAGGGGHKLSGAALVQAVLADPAACRALADALGAHLAPVLVATAARVASGHQAGQAGRRLAATVTSGSGAIQAASGGKPAVALVSVGGAATPVAAVVPAHILPDLTAGAEVWVEPVNGNPQDLLVTAIRAFTGTPTATTALTTANAAMPKAGGTFTGAVSAPSATFNSTPVLASGYQGTGRCGLELVNAVTGNTAGYGVNFKQTMTNTPTSITLTVNVQSSVSSVGTARIDSTGFDFLLLPSAAGHVYWYGSYTTSGNTLLAVDAAAQTIDHHCDGCDTVRTGIPFAALQVLADGPAVAYSCPTCGNRTESFNGALPASEAAGYDLSDPHARPTRVYLARALWGALGLPVPA